MNTTSKIKTIEEVAKISQSLRRDGKKIIHCHGVFDLLHPGHIKHFQAAKKQGDILLVTLTKDEYVNKGPGRPVFNQNLRAESIAAIECVDYVVINNWPTAIETIRRIKPHFYVKGSDYADKDKDVTGKIYEEEQAVKAVGGKIYFTDDIVFSSSSLINNFFSSHSQEAKKFFLKFKNKFNADDVLGVLNGIKDAKILVIGDIIIDEYHYCAGMGKAQKDTMVTTKYINNEIFAGGVLAAANHIAGFCKNVTLLSCIGTKNNYKKFIQNSLKTHIKTHFYYSKDMPTVVKRRFVDHAFLNKLFEICYLDDKGVSALVESQICEYLRGHLKNFDIVIVTDFGHGLITPRVVKFLQAKAKFLAINVQTNSANLGYNLITKFSSADYICIDEPEIRLACHDRTSNLKTLIMSISKKLNCKKIIITRGHKGSLVYDRKKGFAEIPVFSQEVVDRMGAGDAYFSVTSPCVFKNNPMDMVGFIGNAVGAMKVLIVGHRASIEPVPLYKYISALLK